MLNGQTTIILLRARRRRRNRNPPRGHMAVPQNLNQGQPKLRVGKGKRLFRRISLKTMSRVTTIDILNTKQLVHKPNKRVSPCRDRGVFRTHSLLTCSDYDQATGQYYTYPETTQGMCESSTWITTIPY